ncbi:MAG: methyltransferase domain-containing protein [Methanomicrobiales archaeon]|jgi:ubiquinone/menaquinone biosynthesis C-methylase UbiE|nr:methyltransferase domain-containing protein [Methanomicrobiales archaeon]
MIDIIFPIPPGYNENPIWTGHDFKIGSDHVSVLRYSEAFAGWNCDLTEFNEVKTSEGNHYLERASRLHACREVTKYVPEHGIVLEVGSSSGYFIRDLIQVLPNASIISSDCFPEELDKISKKYKTPSLQFDLVNCPLPDSCIDVIVALNVLEHIDKDESALDQMYRILKPGGYAVIEVPANQDLYDFHDSELKHFRRYDMPELIDKSKKSGFDIQSHSHLGFFVYPAFRTIKLRNKASSSSTPQESVKRQSEYSFTFNPFFTAIMHIELFLSNIFSYPFGVRCLVTLKKPQLQS